VCAERWGETIVLTDDVSDDEGDGDRGGLVVLEPTSDGVRDGCLTLTALAFDVAVGLRLRLAYLDASDRCRPFIGRFQ
jgi:hypothetical protein